MRPKVLHEPWRTFFAALDKELSARCDLHCFGGFVLTEHYGVTRATIDVDVVDVRGADAAEIARRAGRGSPLHRRHRAYIDVVTIAEVPDDYESRLIDMHVQGLTRVRLLAFERHDLVLAKLARNTDRDREDVVALARGPGLDTAVLRSRYQDELRPTLGRPDREDLTLELWIEMILKITGKAPDDSKHLAGSGVTERRYRTLAPQAQSTLLGTPAEHTLLCP
jgi:hypothetical protein